MVPADARLLESRDLYIQQATLTGESLPVEKQARGGEVSTRPDAENYFAYLATATIAYLVLVEFGKRFLLGRPAGEEH